MAFYLNGENIPFTLEHQRYRFRDCSSRGSYTILYTQPANAGSVSCVRDAGIAEPVS